MFNNKGIWCFFQIDKQIIENNKKIYYNKYSNLLLYRLDFRIIANRLRNRTDSYKDI